MYVIELSTIECTYNINLESLIKFSRGDRPKSSIWRGLAFERIFIRFTAQANAPAMLDSLSKAGADLKTKLETAVTEDGENSSGIIGRANLAHALNVLARESGIWVLPFAGIAHVHELGSKSQLLVDAMEMLSQLARPSLHADIVLGRVPASAELPD